MNEHDEEHPYRWTDNCTSMMELAAKHFSPSELALNLSRISSKKRLTTNPKTTSKSIQAMNLAKVPADGGLWDTKSGREYGSGLAIGVGIGVVNALAVILAIRMCQSKKGNAENLERLIQ